MDLWQAAQIGIRRWYITLPAIAAGLAIAFLVSSGVDPEYRASAALFYKAPGVNLVIADGVNQTEIPGDALAPGTRAVAQTSAARLDKQARLAADEQDLDADFIIQIPDGQVPHVTIDVLTADPELSVDTLDFVVSFARDDILARQFGADQRLLNDVEIVYQDQDAEEDLSSRSRMLIALGLVTMIAAFALTVAIDGFLESRGQKSKDKTTGDQSSGRTATAIASEHPANADPAVPVPSGNKTLAQELEDLEAEAAAGSSTGKQQ